MASHWVRTKNGWRQKDFTPADEKQLRSCLTCHFNPMSEAEFAASRLTNTVDFICQFNGMFRVKDMNFYDEGGTICQNYQIKRG